MTLKSNVIKYSDLAEESYRNDENVFLGENFSFRLQYFGIHL